MTTAHTFGVIGAGTIDAGIAQGCVAAGNHGRKYGRGSYAYERAK